MPQIQRSQVQPIGFRCRFETAAADSPPSHEFCVFDFPCCEACPKAQLQRVRGSEDPMKSEVWHAWIARLTRPKLLAPIREVSYGQVHSPRELGPVQETSR
jgi:hypothetical protein